MSFLHPWIDYIYIAFMQECILANGSIIAKKLNYPTWQDFIG